MVLDSEEARAAFETATDLTVGLEEEFALLDPELGLTPAFERMRSAAQSVPALAESISGELISSEIEIRSGRGADLAAAIATQRDHRRQLFELAAGLGIGLAATGTHPWSDYREQKIIDTDHYRRVEDGLKYVAWRNNTFSLHVHVGIRGPDRAVQVCDRLRPVLPLLLAISASSPFLDGRDSGLASARSQIFTKSFPRCGVPEPFGSWDAFTEYVKFLERTGSIVEYTQVWWSIRPHPAFGTVEVRICDCQISAQESEGLAALIVACVAQAAREVDEGVPRADLPGRMIEENFWRAIRYGLDGQLIDLVQGDTYPAASALDRLLSWTEPVRAELGHDISLPGANGAQRQRQMLQGGMSLPERIWCDRGRDPGDLRAGPRGAEEVERVAEPTEEQLREAYEQQLKQVRVEQILIEEVVTIINLGMRRTGLAPGTEDEQDPDQVRVAIEAVRALLPLVEQISPEHLSQIRDALSQLQMAYVRIGGQAPPAGEGGAGGSPPPGGGGATEPPPPPAKPGEPGPAQRSGRLWVPGQ